MELPPYRIPTARATVKHMWDKCAQYIRKIGTTILLATVVIWALSYYPRPKEEPIAQQEIVTELGVVEADHRAETLAGSYLGQVGRFIEPVMRPLGLDWRAGVALVTSIPAKELVVSSMAVLYGGDDIASLSENITTRSGITPRSAVAFMIFILLFFPCIGTLATIRSETGSRGWMWFTIIYNTAVAWLLAWLAYLIF
jgi:ferrous iron transport protein B